MHISGLNIYPVKSLRGFAAESAEIDALGFVGDRRFLVVDPQGNFLTQRNFARMARVDAFLDATTMTLKMKGLSDHAVLRGSDPSAPLLTVRVWSSEGLQAEDCGDAAAAWISEALGGPCRLVRVGAAFKRPVTKAAAAPGDVHAFADAVPFLVVNEASVDALNQRIVESGGEPVPMDRFRTNLVISGCEPFAEDSWRRIRIGNIVFRSVGPCARCIVTTTDQRTGERGDEPLRTLARFRRDAGNPTNVNFGTNLVHDSTEGVLRVGDKAEVLE